ncbi:hypothetical protein [Ruegeria sp. ANG-R]|uniref:hypothetical protein n=1 Tax=Ruegeria sp. ANG-R TaxID=1577903 RepID=UPI0009E3F7D7|nr:hypothetical protein [Ruegeria sp. ANG-R]
MELAERKLARAGEQGPAPTADTDLRVEYADRKAFALSCYEVDEFDGHTPRILQPDHSGQGPAPLSDKI